MEPVVNESKHEFVDGRISLARDVRRLARASRARAAHQLDLAQGRKNREIERVKAEALRIEQARQRTRELIGHELRRIDYEKDRIQREVVRVDEQQERNKEVVKRGKIATSYERDRIALEAVRINQQKSRMMEGIEREKHHISYEMTRVEKERNRFARYLARFKVTPELALVSTETQEVGITISY